MEKKEIPQKPKFETDLKNKILIKAKMPIKSKELQEALDTWIAYNKESQFNDEFHELIRENNEEKLSQLFLQRLDFGTAGLRGRMGCGFACMNDVVIIQAAQGLLEYIQLNIQDASESGIIIGYDGRHYSRRFAELTATVFLTANIRVNLFSDVIPTPFIPFGIKLLKAAAGVMVTASHNPKDDNGYKVYWSNSAQIISPHDKGIKSCIMKNLMPRDSSWKTEIICNHPRVENPLQKVFQTYIKRQVDIAYNLSMNEESKCLFTYTAMHGVGYKYIREVFQNLKFEPLISVTDQENPDPEFPTVKFPNPEEGKSALHLSFVTADLNGSSIILANDPDADRLAVAEKLRSTNQWKVYTGNETGTLLGWWILENFKKNNTNIKHFSDVYFISSTVSSKIFQSIAKVENLSFEETLTGFKWMGNRAYDLMNQGKTVIFAFEESIGFMCDTECLDKDGISAASKVAELVAFLDTKGLTLYDKLMEIYDVYGQHLYASSYYFCYETQVIKKIFNRLRNWNKEINTYPEYIANGKYKISGVRDLTTGFDSTMPDKKPILPVSKSSEMITFNFENGFTCTLRTSGTEPKIKYYCELIAPPEEKNIKKLEEVSKEMILILVQEFLQPDLNNLVSKSD